jgi:hypothetical protein
LRAERHRGVCRQTALLWILGAPQTFAKFHIVAKTWPAPVAHALQAPVVEQDLANCRDRAQFMRVAGELMRRILVDYAWARGAAKRTSGTSRVDNDEAELGLDLPSNGGAG